MGIVWTIVVGFVAGVIAKFIMPGTDRCRGAGAGDPRPIQEAGAIATCGTGKSGRAAGNAWGRTVRVALALRR